MVKKSNHFCYCDQPKVAARQFSAEVTNSRASAILSSDKKWVNGTTLHYYFFTKSGWRGTSAEKSVVRKAFKAWQAIGIGLDFKEVDNVDEAEIRIGFQRGDGAWSYIGRDILSQGQSERTMNFGWNISNDIDTAMHEIGHTLGLPHEHQNPNAGIVWNDEAVYQALVKPPNSWSREQTFWNIIRKLPEAEVEGSGWDKDSIMHYPFEAGMILNPDEFQDAPLIPKAGLSATDKEWMKTFYPPINDAKHKVLKPFSAISSTLEPGEQIDLLIKPSATRKYDISTFGKSDTVMVLFEKEGGDLRYITADDDSGEDYNASFNVKLFSGRTYILRTRLYWQDRHGGVLL